MSQESKIPFLRNFSPGLNLMMIFSLIFMGTLVFQLLVFMLIKLMWGVSIFSDNDVFSNLKNDSVLAMLEVTFIIQVICVFITPATVFGRLMEYPGQDYLLIRRKISWRTSLYIAMLFLICFPASNFLYYVNTLLDFSAISPETGQFFKDVEKTALESNKERFANPGVMMYLLGMFSTALLTAIGEELIFRSAFQRVFIKIFRNAHIGVFACAILFSLWHFSYYGFLSRMFMGLVLGYIYLSTANVWYCILFHFLHNGFIITLYFLSARGFDISVFDSIGAGETDKWIGLALMATICVFAFTYLKRLINRELVDELKEY